MSDLQRAEPAETNHRGRPRGLLPRFSAIGRSALPPGPSDAQAATRASRRPTRIRLPKRRWQRALLFGVPAFALFLVASGLLYLRYIEQQFREARVQADVVRLRVEDATGGEGLNSQDLDQLNQDLTLLESELTDLDDQLNLPVLGDIARNAPVVSHRVKAAQDLLDLGIELTSIAREATTIATEVRTTFEATGFTTSDAAAGPTWLDVVRARRADLDELVQRFDASLAVRAGLDEERLPDRGRSALASVDGLLNRAAELRADYYDLLPLLDPALGATEDARYLVLLQNSQEMRQSGGFAGTYAMLTIQNGRLSQLAIDRIDVLNGAYVARRTEPIPTPGPIRELLGMPEWFPHDATWSADFPEAAATLLRMYEISGLPPVQGVIAINFSAIETVLEVIGPYEVEVSGDRQTISADNIVEVIDSYRETQQHKGVVAVLGTTLIEQLRATDFEQKKTIYHELRDLADRREIQVFLSEPALQAQVIERGWHGPLQPLPGTPTLAMTVSNMAGSKSSTKLEPRAELELTPGNTDGTTHARWTITIEHTGDPRGDRTFDGFHQTWLALYLPEGAQLTTSSIPPAGPELNDDPRAIGYTIGILPGETETLTIEFELPAGNQSLVLRRQSGLNDVDYRVNVVAGGSTLDQQAVLDRDLVVDLAACSIAPTR